jgi:tetratricopeptide (TPR) repeat protein
MSRVFSYLVTAGLFSTCCAELSAQPTTPPTPPASATPAEIDQLIRLLGDNSFAKRTQATQKLTELGPQVLPALRAARKNPDPEVSQRAESIYRAISELSPERRAAIAAAAAKAFAEADYQEAAKQQTFLAYRLRPTIEECLFLGRAWQLAGKWANAVTGYQRALERLEEVLAGDPETDPVPVPLHGRDQMIAWSGPVPPGASPVLSEQQRRELAAKRAGLILLIGRLQHDRLDDPAAAAVTFTRILGSVPEFRGDLPTLLAGLATDVPRRRARQPIARDISRGLALIDEFEIMEELARAQERLGRIDDAILTQARLNNTRLHTRDDEVDGSLAQMARLIQKSAAIRSLPPAVKLVSLSPPPRPVPKKTLETEVSPTQGNLKLDDKPLANSIAVDDIAPGPHQITYQPQGALPPVRLQATFKPGLDYRLFINAASPFRWDLTNLGDFQLGSIAIRDLARLPDGRWVAALTAGERVFTATTRDWTTWDLPQLLPASVFGNNIDPAITVDDAGVIWIAWFSNCLSLHPRGSAGYSLWLAHSADGKTWSAPRAIQANTGGWPMGTLHWLKTPGQFRLSWRAESATEASPAQMTKLDRIDLDGNPQKGLLHDMWPLAPDVVRDDEGRYHMLWNDPLWGITYTSSADGKKWAQPLFLISKPENRPFSDAQMFLDGKRAALIYADDSGTHLRRFNLADLFTIAPPIQISGRSASTLGVRWQRSGDQIFGFVAGEAPWLVRASVKDLFEKR